MDNAHNYCGKTPVPTKRNYEKSGEVARILSEVGQLSSKDQFALILELVKSKDLTQPEANTIKNYITNRAKEQKKYQASEQQSTVDSRASPEVSTASALKAVPAVKVSLIVRADLISEGIVLCLDMEKVIDKEHLNKAGDFALVDLKGRLVFWCYVQRDNVCRYNTKLTGLDKEKLERGIPEEMVRDILKTILRKNVIVGAAIIDDLKSIGYKSVEDLPTGTILEDIQDFYRDQQGDKISLRLLGEHFTGESFQEATHSSVRDARMTALCYKKMTKLKEVGLTRFKCPDFDRFREEDRLQRKKEKGRRKCSGFEKCTCAVPPEKRKKKQNWASTANVDIDFFD